MRFFRGLALKEIARPVSRVLLSNQEHSEEMTRWIKWPMYWYLYILYTILGRHKMKFRVIVFSFFSRSWTNYVKEIHVNAYGRICSKNIDLRYGIRKSSPNLFLAVHPILSFLFDLSFFYVSLLSFLTLVLSSSTIFLSSNIISYSMSPLHSRIRSIRNFFFYCECRRERCSFFFLSFILFEGGG